MVDRALGNFNPTAAEAKTDPFFANSGEVFYPSEDATRYNYNNITEKWEMGSVRIRIAEKHFASGGMRLAYRAGIVNPESTVTSCVVKVFKHVDAVTPDMVFHEALTQSVAQSYGMAFNTLVQEHGLGKKSKVQFLPVTVLHLPQRGPNYYAAAEPYLQYSSTYVKHNDNQGGAAPDTDEGELAQTFSYFSFVASKGALVVCDIQGVGNTFTDPQIHSADGKRLFGAGNMGQKGINRFLSTFTYSKTCAILGLPKPEPHADYVEMRQIMGELGSFMNFQTNVVKQAAVQKRQTALRQSQAEEKRRPSGKPPKPQATSGGGGGRRPSAGKPKATSPKLTAMADGGAGSRRSLSRLVSRLTGSSKRLSTSSGGAKAANQLSSPVTKGPPLPPRKKTPRAVVSSRSTSGEIDLDKFHLGLPYRSRDATLDELLGDGAKAVQDPTDQYTLFHLV